MGEGAGLFSKAELVAAPDGEWRSGWPLTLAAFLGIFTAVLYVYSTGLFIEPLHAEFGWSRSAVTGGMMVVGVAAALGNPLVGLLLDRMRAGRIAFAGSAAYALSLGSKPNQALDFG